MDTHIQTFKSTSKLNTILKILGLNHVSIWKKELSVDQFSIQNNIVFGFFTVVNIFFLILKIRNNLEAKHYEANFTFNDTIQLIFIFAYIEYAVDFCLAYKYRIERANYFILYAKIDSLLGIPDFATLTKKMNKILACFTIAWFLSSIGDYLALFYVYGWWEPFLYSLEYIYMFATSMTVLDIVSILMHIECRLESFVRYLKEYYRVSISHEVLSENLDGLDRNVSQWNQLKTVASGNPDVLFLNKSYLLLAEQVAYINKAYGVRLLVYNFTILLSLIHHTNVMMRLGRGIFSTGFLIDHLPLFSTMSRLMTICAVFLLLIYWCEKNYKENEALRYIDLMLVKNNIPPETRLALKDLRSLVVTRPLRVHAADFFTCNYPLLVSIVSVVGTYTIILYEKIQ